MTSSKSKNFDWNIETTKLLINLYEENECLYNNFNPEYKNRDKRLLVMTNIAKVIQESTGTICLVADVRKKINSLRSQYLAEKLKITKCKSGSGGDYTPSVYWFPLLRFLDISTEADPSYTNMDGQTDQDDSVSMDTHQTHGEQTERPTSTKKKKKLGPAEAGDADDLIREATDTMRQMSQHITSKARTNSDSHITIFCDFVNSELTSILHASNNNFVVKAKRKIQMCLFDIWDEIDTTNMHEDYERPFTQCSNYSDNSVSQNTQKSKSVVTGNHSSIVIKRNGNKHEERPFTQFSNYSENSASSQNTQKSKSVVTGKLRSIVIKRTGKKHEERQFKHHTNYSEDSASSQNSQKSKSVVIGNPSSIVIKRNSPQENSNVVNCIEDESSEDIVMYDNDYDNFDHDDH